METRSVYCNMPDTFDLTASALTASVSSNKLYSAVLLGLVIVIAIFFIAYLLRCYLQEFRRNKRFRKRREPCSRPSLTLPASLTYAPPKRKTPSYSVGPTIHYTVTATSAFQTIILLDPSRAQLAGDLLNIPYDVT